VNAGQVAGHLLNAHWLPIFKEIFKEEREEKLVGPNKEGGTASRQGGVVKQEEAPLPSVDASVHSDSKEAITIFQLCPGPGAIFPR